MLLHPDRLPLKLHDLADVTDDKVRAGASGQMWGSSGTRVKQPAQLLRYIA